jgi:hypothetical protein
VPWHGPLVFRVMASRLTCYHGMFDMGLAGFPGFDFFLSAGRVPVASPSHACNAMLQHSGATKYVTVMTCNQVMTYHQCSARCHAMELDMPEYILGVTLPRTT